jgi:hypothetical protein
MGRGGRDLVAELFERITERWARLPLKSRVAGIAAVLLALTGAVWLQAVNAPKPPAPLRLQLSGVSFTPTREGDGLSMSVALRNDAATGDVLYSSTIAIDGLQTGRTQNSPFGAVNGAAAFTYGFALPFDCGANGASGAALKTTNPRPDAHQLVVVAAGYDGVRREVRFPFATDPWKDFAKARADYCSGTAPHDVVIAYEGDRAPADTANHSFRIVLSIADRGLAPVRVDSVLLTSTQLSVRPENVPTTVSAGDLGALFLTIVVANCRTARQEIPQQYLTVFLSTLPDGPRVVAVPLPADAIAAQIRASCPV